MCRLSYLLVQPLPPTFTTRTALDAGLSSRDLYQLGDSGELIELSRGVLRSPGPSVEGLRTKSRRSRRFCYRATSFCRVGDRKRIHTQAVSVAPSAPAGARRQQATADSVQRWHQPVDDDRDRNGGQDQRAQDRGQRAEPAAECEIEHGQGGKDGQPDHGGKLVLARWADRECGRGGTGPGCV